MTTTLTFEDKETKLLLSRLSFQYFLDRNIETERYSEEQIAQMHTKYREVLALIKHRTPGSGLQQRYYLEGQVRKMFLGGFLPALFQLNDAKKFSFFDFEAVGENWAYFDRWQTLYKRKVLLDKMWDIIIKTGSLLAIILSILKVLETFKIRII